jgi:tetratricopeptide (TPR) repeat protein
VADAAALATGEIPPPGDPRREEVRAALGHAARLGVLIHLAHEEHYCIPFPMRLSFEGVEFLNDREQDSLRLRVVQHFGRLAATLAADQGGLSPRHWRFANILAAWEMAVDAMEEQAGLSAYDWVEDWESIEEIPADLHGPLSGFLRCIGKSLVSRQSESGLRLLAAAGAAGRTAHDEALEAEARSLIGQYFLKRGAFGRAIESYRRSEALLGRVGDMRALVLAISAAAIAHRELGHFDLAISEFLRARALALTHELHEAEIDTANCAARLLINEGRPFEALQLVRAVLESGTEPRQRYPASAELQVLLAVALAAEGRADEAREELFLALMAARRHDHRPAQASASLELARLCSQTREFDEALIWGGRARALYSETADQAGIAEASLILARVHRLQHATTDCDDLLLKALRAAQSARAMKLVADIWHERALLRLDEDDVSQAITSFGQESKALRHTRHHARRVDIHLRVSELLHSQDGHAAAAAEAFRAQAVARLHQLDSVDRVNHAITHLRPFLTDEQFDHLIEEITEEVEG